MKRDTRQEILRTAKELFNQHGFNAVSTRDIAAVLGISKGNLTYYFKKKEDIIAAIVTAAPKPGAPAAPTSLAELDAFLLDIQQVVAENAFYFWHHAQLAQTAPQIQALQGRVYADTAAKLRQTCRTLRAQGLLQQEPYAGADERLVDTLLLCGVYWLPFGQLKQGQAAPVSFQQQAWSMLYPLLTEQGRETLRQLSHAFQ